MQLLCLSGLPIPPPPGVILEPAGHLSKSNRGTAFQKTWSCSKFCEGGRSEGRNKEALRVRSGFPVQRTGLQHLAAGAALGSAG